MSGRKFNYEDRAVLDAVRAEINEITESEWPRYKENTLLEDAVLEVCSTSQTPRETVITVALGAMATAVQGIINVRTPVNRITNCSLMLLTIAQSGERKSSVQNEFFQAIIEKDACNDKEFKGKKIKYDVKLALWNRKGVAINSTFKKGIVNLINENDNDGGDDGYLLHDLITDFEKKQSSLMDAHELKKPSQPKYKRILYEDTSIQSLLVNIHNNSRNACLLSDEAITFFNGKALDQMGQLNKLWDGSTIYVDRISRDSLRIDNARLTLSLMTQPSVVESFLNKKGGQARGVGLLARFLVVRPPEQAGNRPAQKKELSKSIENFNHRVAELLNYAALMEENEDEKIVLEFTQTASEFWMETSNKVELMQKKGGYFYYYRDYASKLLENISRVAGIIEYFHAVEKEASEIVIRKETLEFATDLCFRYAKHFINELAGEPKAIKDASELVEYFIQYGQTQTQNRDFSFNGKKYRNGRSYSLERTNLMQRGPSKFRDSDKAKEYFDEIVELLKQIGHLDESPTKPITYTLKEIPNNNHSGLWNGEAYNIRGLPFKSQLHLISEFDILIATHGEQEANYLLHGMGRFGRSSSLYICVDD